MKTRLVTKLLSFALPLASVLAVGCSADEEQAPPPPEKESSRIESSLERKLAMGIAIPTNTQIGASIDAMVAARVGDAPPAAPAPTPVPDDGADPPAPAPPADGPAAAPGLLVAHEIGGTIGANGQKCTMVRFDDEKGTEQMRRTKCGKTDELRVGKITFTDHDGDGKIDEVVDLTTARFEAIDDNRDGKVDRIVEFAERMAAPRPSLTDFGDGVEFTNGGTFASRTREDRDHDGKFDVESVTATTGFRVRTK